MTKSQNKAALNVILLSVASPGSVRRYWIVGVGFIWAEGRPTLIIQTSVLPFGFLDSLAPTALEL